MFFWHCGDEKNFKPTSILLEPLGSSIFKCLEFSGCSNTHIVGHHDCEQCLAVRVERYVERGGLEENEYCMKD